MALGMGLSYRWVAKAEEDRPVMVDARNMDRMPPIAEVAEKLNPDGGGHHQHELREEPAPQRRAGESLRRR